MNPKTVIPLVIALALGGVAAKLGKDMVDKRKQTSGPSIKLARLVIAKQDIAPGAVLKDTDLVLGNVPAETVPQYSFTEPSQLVGRVVTAQIVKGQTMLGTLLAPEGAVGGANVMIPKGMRAVTLEVNEFSGVAGLLAPGCYVDVVQTLRLKDDDAMMAKTVVENLRVLAVGRRMSTVGTDAEPAKSVTLLASQEQAEIIDLAAHLGNPRLVLRNGQDSATGGGKGVTVAELRGKHEDDVPVDLDSLVNKAFGPATRPAEKSQTVSNDPPTTQPSFRDVEVIRGGTSTNVKLPLPPAGPMTSGSDKLQDAVPADR